MTPPPFSPTHVTSELQTSSRDSGGGSSAGGNTSGDASGGDSPSQHVFQTALTHALARVHGVVGGAIPIEHLDFSGGDDDDNNRGGVGGGGGAGGRSRGRVATGIVKCHRDDADKLRTAVALLTETHDGHACSARVMASSTSLVSLAGFHFLIPSY